METNAIAENEEHWIQEAEANNNNKINWAQAIEAEIVEVLIPTVKQRENPAAQVFEILKYGSQTVWRVFWALWAMPTIRIQKAPGEYTHAEEYQNLQNQVGIQNHFKPY